MSQGFGPIIRKLAAVIVDCEFSKYLDDPLALKLPLEVIAKDASSFNFLEYNRVFQKKAPFMYRLLSDFYIEI